MGDGDHLNRRNETPAASVPAWLVSILLVSVAGVMLQNAGYLPGLGGRVAKESRPITPRGDLSDDEKSTIQLFRETSPSVVHITTLTQGRDPLSFRALDVPDGTGTGFVYDDAGHIVTNFHVIQKARSARIMLADNSTWEATLVGYDRDKDLAVLKIKAPPARLKKVAIGESAGLQVGQKVFAIGSPFGLDQTLTTGVISGLGREIESVGGGMITGRLIGVNTMIVSPSGAFSGVGFAVPVDTVNQSVPELIRLGVIERGTLGVQLLEDGMARRLGVRGGALVNRVFEKSGAEAAGILSTYRDIDGTIHLGDILVEVAGRGVTGSSDIPRALDGKKAGEEITVVVVRRNQKVPLKVRLQAAPR